MPKPQGGVERAVAEAEAEEARRLDEVRQRFVSKLQEQSSCVEETLELIESRLGDDRRDSFDRLGKAMQRLDALQDDHHAEAKKAEYTIFFGEEESEQVQRHVAQFKAEIDRELSKLRQSEVALRSQVEAEERHLGRIPGLADLDIDPVERTIITKACHVAAVLIVNHFMPSAGEPVVRTAETLWKAYETVKELDRADAMKIRVPVSVCGGLAELEIGTTLSDDDRSGGEPLTLELGLGLGGEADTSLHIKPPQIEFVEEGVGQQSEGRPEEEPDEHSTVKGLERAKMKAGGHTDDAEGTDEAAC